MDPRVLLSLTCACLVLVACDGQGLRKICYHTNWSQYRPAGGKFYPTDIDPFLCTHYIYAFATLTGNRLKAFEWNDKSTTWMRGMYAKFNDIKTTNPKAKTLLGVGGWNLGSGPFHALVTNPTGKREFAQSAIEFCRKYNFDGIDLDWEYPANRGSPPEDRQHFSELLKTVHDAFDSEARQSMKPRLILSAAVAAGKPKIDTAYDIPYISTLLDFINVMTYDFHGSWEDHTGHNSPLYSRYGETGNDTYYNVHSASQYWVSNGAPKSKLNIGVAFFGRTFTLKGSDSSIGAPAKGPGTAGPYTREKGFLSYAEICEMRNRGGRVEEIPEQRVRYMSLGDQWVGFDDVQSIKAKVCHIKENQFGGVMMWALDCDDFSGSSCNEGPYPLLHAMAAEADSQDRSNCVGPGPRPPTTTPQVTTKPINVIPNIQTTIKPHVIQTTKDFNCYGRASGFYPSPFDCTEYYICANHMAFRVNCAYGLRYNPTTKYCDLSTKVQCLVAQLVPVLPTTLAPITQTAIQPTQITWNPKSMANLFCRHHVDGLYSKPLTCTKYYQCYNQIGFEHECPLNEAFNQQIQACDFNYRVPGC